MVPAHVLELARLAHGAGRIVEEVRAGDIDVRLKPDESPVTQADTLAEAFIEEALGRSFPGVPVIGEELVAAGRAVSPGKRFFLVDPLDGTREFIAGRDSYSTNIALVEHGRSVAGAVYAPARGELFAAAPGEGLWRAEIDPQAVFDAALLRPYAPPRTERRKPKVAVVSFSHLDEKTEAWLAERGVTEQLRMGSAWKFCVLVKGEADVYPRFGPTMEWDTAAGQAVLEAAGGRTLLPDLSGPLTYDHEESRFLNPGFVALAPGVEL